MGGTSIILVSIHQRRILSNVLHPHLQISPNKPFFQLFPLPLVQPR